MNLLLYVEPLIEMERPYWKEGWATYFGRIIIDTLRNAEGPEGGFDFAIAVNEPLRERSNLDIEHVVFTQAELLKPFDWSYLVASLAWYNSSFTAEQLEYYKILMRTKLAGFCPDIIITFSPAPFFKDAFPNALTLHMEYSLFSRSPYPQSWYLDPVGMLANSFVSSFADKINDITVSEQEMSLLDTFKERCREIIDKKSPFKELLRYERQKYKHLVLVPLQFSQYYGFDGNVSFKNQYEYLTYILETVPKNIGVIVTQHPDYTALTQDTITFIRSKYCNFIFYDEFESYQSSSQYILPDIDAVITVSSSVGLQALIFDKKLVTIGNNYNPIISDSFHLENLDAVLSAEHSNRNGILFWLITRYAITEPYLKNSSWFASFLRRSLKTYREKGITESFYERIDYPEILFSSLHSSLDENIPKRLESKSLHTQLRQQVALSNGLATESTALRTQLDATINYVKDLEKSISNLKDKIKLAELSLKEKDQEIREKERVITEISTDMKDILNSRIWRLTTPLRSFHSLLAKFK